MAGGPVITCPECQKKFKGKADLQGKKIRCPFCKEPFVVPSEAIQAAPAAVTAAPEAPAVSAAPDDELDINPYGASELDLAPRCPNCANEMENEDATICLHCGYNTLTRQWGKTEKRLGSSGGQRFMHLLPAILTAFGLLVLLLVLLLYCLVMPYYVVGSWMAFTDHESLRLWLTMICLGIFWAGGTYCYKRFVVNPLPEEKKLD